MRHIDDGVLRRMIDESPAVSDRARLHVRECTRCRNRMASIGVNMTAAQSLMAVSPASVDSAVALATVKSQVAGATPRRRSSFIPPFVGGMRQRVALVGSVAALVAAVTLTPAGSMAQNFISMFQPASIQPVSLTDNEAQSLAQLASYGTVNVPGAAQASTPKSASSAAQASQLSGMTLLLPSTLPAGVRDAPTYQVQPGTTGTFTFSADKAKQAAAAKGQTLPQMPANLDGSTLEVSTRPMVMTTYPGTGGPDGLVVGQMRAPTVSSTGASVAEMENYVLSLPGISPALAQQIRALGDPTAVLPIPIPVDHTQMHSVQVQGVQGYAVGDNTGLGSGVIWEKDGIIYGVAGPLSQNAALSVANSLR